MLCVRKSLKRYLPLPSFVNGGIKDNFVFCRFRHKTTVSYFASKLKNADALSIIISNAYLFAFDSNRPCRPWYLDSALFHDNIIL